MLELFSSFRMFHLRDHRSHYIIDYSSKPHPPYFNNPWKADSSLIRTLVLDPKGVRISGVPCNSPDSNGKIFQAAKRSCFDARGLHPCCSGLKQPTCRLIATQKCNIICIILQDSSPTPNLTQIPTRAYFPSNSLQFGSIGHQWPHFSQQIASRAKYMWQALFRRCLLISTRPLGCTRKQRAHGLHALYIEWALSIGVASVANKKRSSVTLMDCVPQFGAHQNLVFAWLMLTSCLVVLMTMTIRMKLRLHVKFRNLNTILLAHQALTTTTILI